MSRDYSFTLFYFLLKYFFYVSEQKEKIEMYLSFGASRWEASRPVIVEAIRLAMLPTINSMR